MNKLKTGDRLWNGSIVTQCQADAYNAASAKVASFEASGREAPENLLNGRHNLLNS